MHHGIQELVFDLKQPVTNVLSTFQNKYAMHNVLEAVMGAVHIWKTCAVACRFPACMDETIIELYQCPISEY